MVRHPRRYVRGGVYAAVLVVIFITGCARTGRRPDGTYRRKESGIYHTVSAGETLWRIAQTYGVPLDRLVDSNDISNAAQIDTGQRIFIPGADAPREVIVAGASGEFEWPVRGTILTYFGHRQPSRATSNGVEILVSEGATVRAARDGRVVFADYLAGYADTVIVDHTDGYFTVYGHNADLLVGLDDFVLKGAPLAKAAHTTYFEIRRNDVADNPLYYLP